MGFAFVVDQIVGLPVGGLVLVVLFVVDKILDVFVRVILVFRMFVRKNVCTLLSISWDYVGNTSNLHNRKEFRGSSRVVRVVLEDRAGVDNKRRTTLRGG